MDITIDEDFRSLIPPLAVEELEQLEANIKKEGCRDPLVVWKQSDGCLVLVDGHNRLRICSNFKLPFRSQEMEFSSRDDAKVWIIRNQLGRRNVADIDRVSLGEQLRPLLQKKAKENQTVALKGPRSERSGKIAKTSIDTRKEISKAVGVGQRTYDAARLILEAEKKGEIPKETVEAIRKKEKSIHAVAKQVKETRQREKRQEIRREAAAKVEPQFFDNVHVGDFRELSSKVADGSLSLIFTDPPYDRKALELFGPLADFAASKLCEGGSLLCYVGQTQIPAAITLLSSTLRYWWIVCCLHSGGANLMNEYGIRCGWKAVLWFVKATRDRPDNIVSDVMSGGREKDHHDWQQSQSEAEYWIEKLCPDDGIVCDPFLGGGTTAAAAINLNRRWIGFEKDHDQAVIAMQRCSK